MIEAIETKVGICSSAELIEFLKNLFTEYIRFEDYQKLYQRHATGEDIPFLENYLKTTANKKEQVDISRMIKHIQNNKKNMPRFPVGEAEIKSKKNESLFTTQIKQPRKND